MDNKIETKKTGATFTPQNLADFLSKKIISYINCKEDLNILDPSCGKGELLLSLGNILNQKRLKFTLNGFDNNSSYLKIAKNRLEKFGNNKINLLHSDFLEVIETETEIISNNLFSKKQKRYNDFADIIIGNPPYVRTQILGSDQAQKLAKRFNLKGRVDLYYPFLMAMTASLKRGGLIGVITSNRYLTTKSGASIRKFLNENYDIVEVIDLGDTKLFDVAVLPAIFIGKKKTHKNNSQNKPLFIKVYEERNNHYSCFRRASNIYDILSTHKQGYFTTKDKKYKKTHGKLKLLRSKESNWLLLTNKESRWISNIEKNSPYVIGDFFKVRVGIKTNADKIFIRKNWEKLGNSKPEESLLKELITQDNVRRWKIIKDLNLKVLYPHYTEDNNKKVIDLKYYPKTNRYLTQFKNILEGRKYLIEAGRNWFEIWVPQNPALWKFPKLVFPDISIFPRFYFDNERNIVNGNCYWIVAEKKEDIEKLFLIQGIANSNLMTKYHDLIFTNKLYSGRRRYFSQYVEKYPLPHLDCQASKEIITLVKSLNNSLSDKKASALGHELEIKVAEAYKVEPVFTLD